MKKGIAYILVFLVTFSYNYEGIQYFSKTIGNTSISRMDNFDCEEKGAEKEDSNEKSEKNEKTDFSEELYFDSNLISAQLQLVRLHSKKNHNFSSSDFSQVVYSPPELA